MKKNAVNQFHVNPKFRAYGKARLDIARRADNPEDWNRLWKRPAYPFPFNWGNHWKQCVEYRVDDFAAEVGFFIDILGLPVNAFDPDYAMFTSPDGDFYFSVVPAVEGEPSTPPDAFRIQFMVEDIQETALELERRGIPFEQWPQPCYEGSSLQIGYFRTPHGICIDLWGNAGTGDSGYQPSDEEYPEESQFDTNDQSYEQDQESQASTEEPSAEHTINFNLPPLDGRSSVQIEPDSPVRESEYEEDADELIELKYEYLDDV
jgi:catechol 2,3-dioxygenase-like lactoylglutathione lyase family enzyme